MVDCRDDPLHAVAEDATSADAHAWRAVERLADEVATTHAPGFAGLAVSAEMSWACTSRTDPDRLVVELTESLDPGLRIVLEGSPRGPGTDAEAWA